MEIEIKLSRQEDLVDTLNQMVYQQQKKIAELEALCTALAGRIKDMANTERTSLALDERPPHY